MTIRTSGHLKVSVRSGYVWKASPKTRLTSHYPAHVRTTYI